MVYGSVQSPRELTVEPMPEVRPLDGVTVISLEQAVAAPFATRQLADLGARVIKVERPPDGDFARGYDDAVHGMSSYFFWLNRSKESLTLNVKAEAGREVLERLLATADVFVHNLAPGAIDRLGFGTKTILDRFPRLVCCTINGFGGDGAWAAHKAYDLLVQSEVGLVAITGSGDEMAKVGISIADIAAGMYAYSGVLTALLQRATTGRGSGLEVSLFDALAEWMGAPLYYSHYGGKAPERAGPAHATIAPYGPFATQDGLVVLAVHNEREWAALCSVVLGDVEHATDPRFVGNPARVEHRVELDAIIAARLEPLTSSQVVALLDEAGIAHARLNSMEELAGHPLLRDRGRWAPVRTAAGPVDALRPPVMHDGVDPIMGPVPDVGQHTDTILRELGFSDDDVAEFRSVGVV